MKLREPHLYNSDNINPNFYRAYINKYQFTGVGLLSIIMIIINSGIILTALGGMIGEFIFSK